MVGRLPIYREEGKLKSLSSEERLAQRQAIIQPLLRVFRVYSDYYKERERKRAKREEFDVIVGMQNGINLMRSYEQQTKVHYEKHRYLEHPRYLSRLLARDCIRAECFFHSPFF